ncbi:MAG: hypothetical protein EOS65_02590 [Mesorhizobium sp.]|uniref:hypothetical protein n=1 Tax=Mesorhizobium sp. TaxID=1871066 RepID=UPI000FE56E75|nr:hypothetical protein [Mesorhizobium sp.]RWF44283.1 MAG: hypothetical protein EOS65_02590 [Mesorhizobium sp.]
MAGFYWIRDKRNGEISVAHLDDRIADAGCVWTIMGDEQIWDRESVEQQFDIIGPIPAQPPAGFDVPGARWVDYVTQIGYYEEQLDVSRIDGKWRHRPKVKGDEIQTNAWREGRAPPVHIDTRSGFHKVDRKL